MPGGAFPIGGGGGNGASGGGPLIGTIDSQRWYSINRGFAINNTPTGQNAYAADTLHAVYVPFVPATGMTIDGLGLTTSTGSGNARILVYDSDDEGYPGALLGQSEEFAYSGGAEHEIDMEASVELTKQFWLVWWNSGGGNTFSWDTDSTPGFRRWDLGFASMPNSTALQSPPVFVTRALTYSSVTLPDPFGTPTLVTATRTPSLFYRVE